MPEAAFGLDLSELRKVVDHSRMIADEPGVNDVVIGSASLLGENVLFVGGFVLA